MKTTEDAALVAPTLSALFLDKSAAEVAFLILSYLAHNTKNGDVVAADSCLLGIKASRGITPYKSECDYETPVRILQKEHLIDSWPANEFCECHVISNEGLEVYRHEKPHYNHLLEAAGITES